MRVFLEALLQPADDLWVARQFLLVEVLRDRRWYYLAPCRISKVHSGIEGLCVWIGFVEGVVHALQFLL